MRHDKGLDVRKMLTMGHLTLVLCIISVLASGILVWVGIHFFDREFPRVEVLKSEYPIVTLKTGEEKVTVALVQKRPRNWISLSEVAPVAVNAVLVSEDWAFYQHQGYDPRQINEALRLDIAERRFARGASTITQQVIRNVFLEKDKNLWRKVRELLLAIRLEKAVGKRRILEVYLNIAEWGDGIYGIKEAANYYFGKPPSELSAKESAFLAMLLPSPKRYNSSFHVRTLTPYAQETVKTILEKLVRAKKLSPEDLERELETPLNFRDKY